MPVLVPVAVAVAEATAAVTSLESELWRAPASDRRLEYAAPGVRVDSWAAMDDSRAPYLELRLLYRPGVSSKADETPAAQEEASSPKAAAPEVRSSIQSRGTALGAGVMAGSRGAWMTLA